ncbi:uncharacterized protein PWA37_004856 [Arxiozyma heterogenica]|uniref:uncharacterized protein n=1 Tax=Arxiozyma heterogenica TaxID=278026 RepID=UPI002F0B6823
MFIYGNINAYCVLTIRYYKKYSGLYRETLPLVGTLSYSRKGNNKENLELGPGQLGESECLQNEPSNKPGILFLSAWKHWQMKQTTGRIEANSGERLSGKGGGIVISTDGVDETALKSYVCLVYSERIVHAEGTRREKDTVRKTILLLLVYAGSIWASH